MRKKNNNNETVPVQLKIGDFFSESFQATQEKEEAEKLRAPWDRFVKPGTPGYNRNDNNYNHTFSSGCCDIILTWICIDVYRQWIRPRCCPSQQREDDEST